MSLKLLHIKFEEPDQFFSNVSNLLNSKLKIKKDKSLIFDSVKTFNNFMNTNKVQVLRAISQQKPTSVYQLAAMLGREPHHVLKDCRHLESLSFINLEKSSNSRNSLKPVLFFDYDVIKADSMIISPYVISQRAEKLLVS